MSIKNLDNMILSYLAENNSASPDALAEAFDVSPSTIRRRFCELQDKGLIQRARGCAKLRQDNNFTQSFTFRKHQNSLEKKRIALEAIKLIKNGDVIFLDGSSSAYFIAQYLAQYDNIKVFTNGIDTLSLLAQNNVKAYSTGGMVHKDDKSILGRHLCRTPYRQHTRRYLLFFGAHRRQRRQRVGRIRRRKFGSQPHDRPFGQIGVFVRQFENRAHGRLFHRKGR